MNWTEEELQEYINKKTGSNPPVMPQSPGPPGGDQKKYGNKKVIVDDIKFDSKDESLYYLHLKYLKEKGSIIDFELQPKYELIPKFKYFNESRRAITYSPDFKLTNLDGDIFVIDVKSMGTATQQGEIRRKLFEYRYPDIELLWVCRNLKHGDQYGWIRYEALKKIYRDAKKAKGVK